MDNEGIRLNKYISSAGICSRREADRLIEEGKVTFVRVDGTEEKANLGSRFHEGDKVYLNGKLVEQTDDEKLYLMLK